jgi:hypothetical protein
MYDGAEQAENIGRAVTKQAQLGEYIPPTDRQKLMQKKEAFLAELRRVDAALEMLDKHPELEQFTKVLQAGLR